MSVLKYSTFDILTTRFREPSATIIAGMANPRAVGPTHLIQLEPFHLMSAMGVFPGLDR